VAISKADVLTKSLVFEGRLFALGYLDMVGQTQKTPTSENTYSLVFMLPSEKNSLK
jgi:hypothetical protein